MLHWLIAFPKLWSLILVLMGVLISRDFSADVCYYRVLFHFLLHLRKGWENYHGDRWGLKRESYLIQSLKGFVHPLSQTSVYFVNVSECCAAHLKFYFPKSNHVLSCPCMNFFTNVNCANIKSHSVFVCLVSTGT